MCSLYWVWNMITKSVYFCAIYKLLTSVFSTIEVRVFTFQMNRDLPIVLISAYSSRLNVIYFLLAVFYSHFWESYMQFKGRPQFPLLFNWQQCKRQPCNIFLQTGSYHRWNTCERTPSREWFSILSEIINFNYYCLKATSICLHIELALPHHVCHRTETPGLTHQITDSFSEEVIYSHAELIFHWTNVDLRIDMSVCSANPCKIHPKTRQQHFPPYLYSAALIGALVKVEWINHTGKILAFWGFF